MSAIKTFKCSDCGYKISEDEFNMFCYGESSSREQYVDMIGEAECPECSLGVLEECAS